MSGSRLISIFELLCMYSLGVYITILIWNFFTASGKHGTRCCAREGLSLQLAYLHEYSPVIPLSPCAFRTSLCDKLNHQANRLRRKKKKLSMHSQKRLPYKHEVGAGLQGQCGFDGSISHCIACLHWCWYVWRLSMTGMHFSGGVHTMLLCWKVGCCCERNNFFYFVFQEVKSSQSHHICSNTVMLFNAVISQPWIKSCMWNGMARGLDSLSKPAFA